MPVHIKLTVSIITLIVGALFLYFENRYGQFSIGLIGAGLAAVSYTHLTLPTTPYV